MSLTGILIVSFLAALVAAPVASRIPRGQGWVVALVPAGLFAAIFYLGRNLGVDGAITERIEWVPALDVALEFRLDAFSYFFALLITGIGTLVTIYAGAYFSDYPPKKGASFLAMILFFMGAMLGTIFADHLLVLYVFWEATSLASFLLIGFESHKAEARKSALQSLVVTAGGGLALFAGVLLIGMELGTFTLSEVVGRSDELAASPYAVAILVLVCVGAFTKSAQVPFHFWLPNAMAAPTPASAYLHSATMVKLGVYLLARFDQAFAAMPAFGTTLVVFGCATILVASLRALADPGFKAILAQSTVGSLGMLVMLIGLDDPYAAVATIAFMFAHALYKAALFFCAGTAIHATHETEVTGMRGLSKALPVTAVAASLAAVAMAGLPPTFSFIAKEYIFDAQLQSAYDWLVISTAVIGSAVFVAIALMTTIRPFWRGRNRTNEIHHGEGLGLYLGPLVLGILGFAFGINVDFVRQVVTPAASVLAGETVDPGLYLWAGFTPMLALSALVVALGIVIYLVWPKTLPALSASTGLKQALGDTGYQKVFGGTLNFAERSTRWLQNGDQRHYTLIAIASTLVIVFAGVLLASPPFALDTTFQDPRIAVLSVLLFMAVGAVAGASAQSLMAALVSVGITGFGSAIIFLLNGAPDLALTQFSVEVLIVVILAALLLRLKIRPLPTRSAGERGTDRLISFGFGLMVFLALAALTTQPFDPRLSEYFAQNSYTEAWGRNVVNVILVDFRAIDTLGEIAVVSFAALAAWGLLRRRAVSRKAS